MSRTPDDVQAALRELQTEIHVQIHDEPTSTAEEAADVAGCELGQIVKSLCFTVDDSPILILTAGDNMVDDRKIADLYDVGRKKVRMTDWDTTIEVTGYEPGGVPPVGLAEDIPILIDETFERYEKVYAAAGAPNAIFPIEVDRLIAITDGKLADIKRD